MTKESPNDHQLLNFPSDSVHLFTTSSNDHSHDTNFSTTTTKKQTDNDVFRDDFPLPKQIPLNKLSQLTQFSPSDNESQMTEWTLPFTQTQPSRNLT